MAFYISIFVVIITLSLLENWIEKKTDNKIYITIARIMVVAIPSIVAGIRYGIGTDYPTIYKEMFESAKAFELTNRNRSMEIGYFLLNRIVYLLHGNYYVLIFITSVITNVFFYFGILRYKDKINVTFSYYLFFMLYYQRSFNLIRQFLALSIIFWAFKFLDDDVDKGLIKYIIIVLISSSIHTTSLLLLSVPVIKWFFNKDGKKYYILQGTLILVLLICTLLFDKIGMLMNYIPQLRYYALYLRKSQNTFGIAYFIKIFPIIIPIFFLFKEIKKDKLMTTFAAMNVFGAILQLMMYFTVFHAERIAIGFNITQIILIPYYVKLIKEKYGNKLYIGTIILYVLFHAAFWYNEYIVNYRDETIPYRTIFSIKEGEQVIDEK